MEKYLDNFLRAGFKTIDLVSHLDEHDLDNLGVTLIGHRKKILQKVQELRDNMMPYSVNGDVRPVPTAPHPTAVHIPTPQYPTHPRGGQISTAFNV